MAKSDEQKQVMRDQWRDTLANNTEAGGFFQEVGKMHKAIYLSLIHI